MVFTCSICWSNLECEDAVNATNCGHVFHAHCLQQWWSHSSLCPICRSKCNVRDRRVLHFSLDNTTNEDEFQIDLEHFKGGIKQILQLQDKEILSLSNQLSQEKNKFQREKEKSNRMIEKLKGQLRMEVEKRNDDKKMWRGENVNLMTSNRELLSKVKALEKFKKSTKTPAKATRTSARKTSMDLVQSEATNENCGRKKAGRGVKKTTIKKQTANKKHIPTDNWQVVPEAISLPNLKESEKSRLGMMCVIC